MESNGYILQLKHVQIINSRIMWDFQKTLATNFSQPIHFSYMKVVTTLPLGNI